MAQPTAQEIAFALMDSVGEKISYSGGPTFTIQTVTGLSKSTEDKGDPYAFVVKVAESATTLTVVVASTEDLSDATGEAPNLKRSVEFDSFWRVSLR